MKLAFTHRVAYAMLFEWQRDFGRLPSIRELAAALGVGEARAHQHVEALRLAGLLRWGGRIALARAPEPLPAPRYPGGVRCVMGFGVT